MSAINVRYGSVNKLVVANNQFVLQGVAAINFYSAPALDSASEFVFNTIVATQTAMTGGFGGGPLRVGNNLLFGSGAANATLVAASLGNLSTRSNCFDNATAGAGNSASDVSGSAKLVRTAAAPYDLHLSSNSSVCADAGQSIAGIVDDFDHQQRQRPPDIGADELP